MSETRNYIDFEIVKENWNVYNLNDGSKLKMRNMLKSAWYAKGVDGMKKYSVDIAGTQVLMCHISLQGTKNQSKHTQEQLQNSIKVNNCIYDTLSYEPEEYLLDGNIKVLIHTNITEIMRTKLYDEKGDRIYLINASMDVTITPPKE